MIMMMYQRKPCQIKLQAKTIYGSRVFYSTKPLCCDAFTSGLFSAVSMANPGPKPVSDLTLVEIGSGRLH